MLQFEAEAKEEPLLAREGTGSSGEEPQVSLFLEHLPLNFGDPPDYLPVSEAGKVKASLFLQRYKVTFSCSSPPPPVTFKSIVPTECCEK